MNKKRILALGGAAVILAGAAGLGTLLPARAQYVPNGPYGTHPNRERHPEMTRALIALQNAQGSLSVAAHDYHGHRARALELVNHAIDEVQAGIDSDR